VRDPIARLVLSDTGSEAVVGVAAAYLLAGFRDLASTSRNHAAESPARAARSVHCETGRASSEMPARMQVRASRRADP
jgi:hypothetical protein